LKNRQAAVRINRMYIVVRVFKVKGHVTPWFGFVLLMISALERSKLAPTTKLERSMHSKTSIKNDYWQKPF